MTRALRSLITAGCFVAVGLMLNPALLSAQPPGRGSAPNGGGSAMDMIEMIYQVFEKADVNHDSTVTKAELVQAMKSQTMKSQTNGQRGRGGPQQNAGQQNARQQNPGQQRAGQQMGQQQPPQRQPGGPPPEPGQVLPAGIADSLNLNDRQQRQLDALQAEVDKRLKMILTDDQEQQLMNRPPPPGADQQGDQAGNRGQGPPRRPE